MSSIRMKQVGDTLRKSLAELLLQEAQDPRLQQVRITDVRLSPDLGQARVFFTLIDKTEQKAVTTALQKAAGFFRSELSRRTALRRVPKLFFEYDSLLEQGGDLLSLINKVTAEENDIDSDE